MGKHENGRDSLHRIGVALSAERDRERLLETILLEAKQVCHADGGTLYLLEHGQLRFEILRTDSLELAVGGSAGAPADLPSIHLTDPETGETNRTHVAAAAAALRESINVADAYDAVGFDFSGTRRFDELNDYRTKSVLAIPLLNTERRVVGVLQLLNARDVTTGEVVPFDAEAQHSAEALASLAGIAIENQQLLHAQKALLDSLIKLIAGAIDRKSQHTGQHCERVPKLVRMITQSLCDAREGPFADFDLNDEQWEELRVASWLHDCGKVTTPVHVIDKATKLQTIFDRIELVRARYEILKRDARIAHLESRARRGADTTALDEQYASQIAELESELEFLERANAGTEFLPEAARARIRHLAERQFVQGDRRRPVLSEDELANLCISRGTLTDDERLVINDHIVQTIEMLEALPFPEHLERVPEYAGGHHETMDGRGYPRGVYAGDLPVLARVMAIADVFEALTSHERPYKPAKKLSEAMEIMGRMKQSNHLDPELLDHFIRSGVYREFGELFLSDELLDEVDEVRLLSIVPQPFELPPVEQRQRRQRELLPQYRALRRK